MSVQMKPHAGSELKPPPTVHSDDRLDATNLVVSLQQAWPLMSNHRVAAEFAVAASPPSTSAASLDAMAMQLSELISEGRADGDSCSFDLEVPGLGRLEGRMTIRGPQAEVQLRAQRPSAAAILRERRHDLQHLVQRESDGDVSLSILG